MKVAEARKHGDDLRSAARLKRAVALYHIDIPDFRLPL